MEENDRESVEWPLWKCAALTSFLCGIPLLLFAGITVLSVVVWGALVLVYVCLVRLFGSGFVVQGAIVVIILAILAGLVLSSL
jgi:hypothetical protein